MTHNIAAMTEDQLTAFLAKYRPLIKKAAQRKRDMARDTQTRRNAAQAASERRAAEKADKTAEIMVAQVDTVAAARERYLSLPPSRAKDAAFKQFKAVFPTFVDGLS